MKKIPISVNDEMEAKAKELSELLGMGDTVYGWFPKTLKASIVLGIGYIQMIEKLIPDSQEQEIDLLLQAVKKAKIRAMKIKTIEKSLKELQKV